MGVVHKNTGVTTGGGKKWLFFLFAEVCLFVR